LVSKSCVGACPLSALLAAKLLICCSTPRGRTAFGLDGFHALYSEPPAKTKVQLTVQVKDHILF
jgi:hypothetical protein